MPMPPPKSSTEGPRDRQVYHEMGQMLRALDAVGPCTTDELAGHLGAQYWEAGRFDKALAYLLADGHALYDASGHLQASP